ALRLDVAGHDEDHLAGVGLERLEPRPREDGKPAKLGQTELRAVGVRTLREELRAEQEHGGSGSHHAGSPRLRPSARDASSLRCSRDVNHVTTMMGNSATKLKPNTNAGQPDRGRKIPNWCSHQGRMAT